MPTINTYDPFNTFVEDVPAATTPLSGTELVPVIQSGATKHVAASFLVGATGATGPAGTPGTTGATGATGPAGGGGRTLLTVNTTFYVATTGDDGNDGLTALTPWLTLQHAVDFIGQTYDAGDNFITIQMADGTYDGAFMYFFPIACPGVLITGHAGDVTKVVLNEWNGSTTCFFVLVPNVFVQFESITFSPIKLATDFALFIVGDYSEVNVNDCAFVAHASGSSECVFLVGQSCVLRFGYTFINSAAIAADISVTGNWGHFLAITAQASYTRFNFNTFTLVSTPQWTGAFILVDVDNFDGVVTTSIGSASYNTIADLHTVTFTGSATGSRGKFRSPCSIEFGPVDMTTLPGNSGPTFTSPGIYWSAIEGASLHSGEIARIISGLPNPGDLIAGGWGVFKDTGGGGVYVAYNDAGTIKKVALT